MARDLDPDYVCRLSGPLVLFVPAPCDSRVPYLQQIVAYRATSLGENNDLVRANVFMSFLAVS